MSSLVDKVEEGIFSKMSPQGKWQSFLSLREIAYQIKTAAIKEKHPDWTAEQIEAEVRKIFLYATS